MGDFDLYLAQGERLHVNGRLSQAVQHYSHAISLKPKEAIAYELRAVAYYDQKRYQAALADFNEAIRLNPFNDVAHWGKGKVFAAMGDFSWAVHNYSRAIDLNGDEAEYYQDRAAALRQLGRHVEAEVDERQAVVIS